MELVDTVKFETRSTPGTVRLVINHGDDSVDFKVTAESMRDLGMQLIYAAYDAEKMNG